MYIDALFFESKLLCLSNPQGEDVTNILRLMVQKMPFEKSFYVSSAIWAYQHLVSEIQVLEKDLAREH